MFFPGILISSRKKNQNLPASPAYIQYLIFVPRVHTCQKVDQDVCLNRLSVHKHRQVLTLILRIGVASSLGALWQLSGSSLGALWELVAVAGINVALKAAMVALKKPHPVAVSAPRTKAT
jgi:hypothetical protein